MPVRFRPWDPTRRFVCPVPTWRGAGLPLRRMWAAVHAAPPDWGTLFQRALDLMLVEASAEHDGLRIEVDAGRVAWRSRARLTLVTLELSGFSPRKRALIAATIVKAARYS
jgi:hypothetical protein